MISLKIEIAEECLKKLGHTNIFPSDPAVTRKICKAVQAMYPSFLQCRKLLVRNSRKFTGYTTKLVATDEEILHDRLKQMKKFKEDDLQ